MIGDTRVMLNGTVVIDTGIGEMVVNRMLRDYIEQMRLRVKELERLYLEVLDGINEQKIDIDEWVELDNIMQDILETTTGEPGEEFHEPDPERSDGGPGGHPHRLGRGRRGGLPHGKVGRDGPAAPLRDAGDRSGLDEDLLFLPLPGLLRPDRPRGPSGPHLLHRKAPHGISGVARQALRAGLVTQEPCGGVLNDDIPGNL